MANESTMGKRLSVMAGAYREQEDAPGIAEMGFGERLAMIVDAEWDARRASGRMRLLRQAGLPEPDADVDDVRCDGDRELDRSLILELSNCGWIRNRRNVLGHRRERRRQDLDLERARRRGVQRVLHRALRPAARAARRARGVQGRGPAQAAQEVHQVRPADHRRPAAREGQT